MRRPPLDALVPVLVLLVATGAAAQSLGPCASGNAGGLLGPLDVLFVNGTAGDGGRRVDVPLSQPMSVSLIAPPLATGQFALFGFLGVPGPSDATPLPFGIGTFCFPPCPLAPSLGNVFTLADTFGIGICPALVPATPAPWAIQFPGLGLPTSIALQALVEDPLSGTNLGVSNAVLVNVGCGAGSPSWIQTSSSGSATTTPHYAMAMTATQNDPNPKLVGPGHQYTASVWARIMLAPVANPAAATVWHTWSGGDEVGYYRDRLALDGTTPGIDRIFFVARTTTSTPNFVDWDGAAFSNETTLAPAQSSILRLCIADDGDLIGNDTLGYVHRWDKQNAYQKTTLFQLTNTAASLPWGSSLDTALGKIAYHPPTGLILFPVNNSAVSATGQLYGFDAAGNRLLADQNVLPVAPTGVNSFRFGVTVDTANAACRILFHGGRDSGPMHFVRFADNLQTKVPAQNPSGDTNGGWCGALIGGEFWTNTNVYSYGAVRRLLPTDW